MGGSTPPLQGAGSNIPQRLPGGIGGSLSPVPPVWASAEPCPTRGHSTPSSNWGEIPPAACLTQGVQWEVEASWKGPGWGVLPAQARLLSPVLPPAAQRTGSIKVSPCLSCHPGLAGAVGTEEEQPLPLVLRQR